LRDGNFSDPRLGIDIRKSPDLVGPKLAALRSYQHGLETPRPPPGGADVVSAERGRAVFKNNCAGCHIGGTGTDNNSGALHAPSETGMDAKYRARTANKKYRTTPLRLSGSIRPISTMEACRRYPTSSSTTAACESFG
jgi:hypothetical protein